MTAMTARDVLRSKILGQKSLSDIVELDDGVQIEIRQASVGQILDAMKTEDNKGRLLGILIDCCYVPGTDERVFDEADVESLASMPSGGYWQKLMDAINKQALPAKIEEAEKNSQETGSTS
jgi:hypothetical protein